MTSLPPGASVSPFRLGVVNAGALLVGVLWLGALLQEIPTGLWLVCIIPVLTGCCVQILMKKASGIYLYYGFVFALDMVTSAIILWCALLLGSGNGGYFGPTLLVVAVCSSGIYSGYQYIKQTQQRTDALKPNPAPRDRKRPPSRAANGGAHLPSTAEHFWIRVRALTPLVVAVGLNGAYMLSQQAIYWIFGLSGLLFCVACALADGASWYRARAAAQAERSA